MRAVRAAVAGLAVSACGPAGAVTAPAPAASEGPVPYTLLPSDPVPERPWLVMAPDGGLRELRPRINVPTDPGPPEPPWIGAASRGDCFENRTRGERPPPGFDPKTCANRRGCPRVANVVPIRQCSSSLEVVTVRALRNERGVRPIGSPVAVRGAAHLGRSTVLPGERAEDESADEAARDGRTRPCLPRRSWLSLSSEDTGLCQGVPLLRGSASGDLSCHGDITDNCCRANAALPPLNTSAVAVGKYRGVHRALDTSEVDVVEIDEFCLPAPAPKSSPTP